MTPITFRYAYPVNICNRLLQQNRHYRQLWSMGLSTPYSTASTSSVIQDGSLSIAKTEGLQAALDSKQAALSNVEGTGVALLHGTAQIRKIFGHGGIEITTGINAVDATDPENFQIQVSGASLQQALLDQIDTKQPIVTDGSLAISHINGLQDAIAQSGGTAIDSSSNLHVASIKAGNAVPTEAGASAFGDLEAVTILVNNVRPPIDTPLVLEASNFGEAVRIASNNRIVTISPQMNCMHSLTVKVGRGG